MKLCTNTRCLDGLVPASHGEMLVRCGHCALIEKDKRIAELEAIIRDAPCPAQEYWATPSCPFAKCNCWKANVAALKESSE